MPSGTFAYGMVTITAASSLLVFFDPFSPPFQLEWEAIHLSFGLTMLGALLVHFTTRRRLCAYKSKESD